MFFLVIVSWAAAGALVGVLASRVINLRGDDPKFGVVAATVAAVVAGAAYGFFSGTGASTWTLWGVLAAAAGGLVAVVAWHAVRSRSISHERYVPRRSY